MNFKDQFKQKEKPYKDDQSPLQSLFLPLLGALVLIIGFIACIYFATKKDGSKAINKQYEAEHNR
jgi:hypothetical protein